MNDCFVKFACDVVSVHLISKVVTKTKAKHCCHISDFCVPPFPNYGLQNCNYYNGDASLILKDQRKNLSKNITRNQKTHKQNYKFYIKRMSEIFHIKLI